MTISRVVLVLDAPKITAAYQTAVEQGNLEAFMACPLREFFSTTSVGPPVAESKVCYLPDEVIVEILAKPIKELGGMRENKNVGTRAYILLANKFRFVWEIFSETEAQLGRGPWNLGPKSLIFVLNYFTNLGIPHDQVRARNDLIDKAKQLTSK